jgi:hypothetical protein
MGDPIQYDVFICYNNKDESSAKELAEKLKNAGLIVFFAVWDLPPGTDYQEVLEKVIKIARSAAVLVGEHGLSKWAKREMKACFFEHDRREMKVIPVILSGGNKSELPLFLVNHTIVDMRAGFKNDKLKELVWGIRGNRPRRQRTNGITNRERKKDNQVHVIAEKEAERDLPQPPTFGFTKESLFGDRLNDTRDAKDAIAEYCTHADTKFKWGNTVFLQSGSLAAVMLYYIYRVCPRKEPIKLLTNMLACSAISKEAKKHAVASIQPYTVSDNIETHLLGGKVVDDFAATMPEQLFGPTRSFDSIDYFKMKQLDHVVMMATYFTVEDGPHSNDIATCRLKKLLMRYIYENSNLEPQLSILFEANKLTTNKSDNPTAADTIDLPGDTPVGYWKKLIRQHGRVNVITALSGGMKIEERNFVKRVLRAAEKRGANPVVLLGVDGEPISLTEE